MSKKVVCPYCKMSVIPPSTKLEHIIPEGLGSPILNPNVCNKCNDMASIKVDGPYFNNLAIKILAVVTGTKTKKGVLKPLPLNTIFNENLQLVVEKSKFSFSGEISPKSVRKLFEKNGESEFPAIDASLKEAVCEYEHAKLFLGLLSMCVPNFVTSKTADTLRKIMWHGTRPELELPDGERINGSLFGKVIKSVTDSDGPNLYKMKNHIIVIKGEPNGSIFSYIDIYNSLRPNLLTSEQKEEWKNINIEIHIDPEKKSIVKVVGIKKIDLTKQYPKYENGCMFEY